MYRRRLGGGGRGVIQCSKRGVGCISIFLDKFSSVSVTIGLGFCVSGEFVRCNVA